MRRKSKNLLASLTMFALLFSLFQPTFAVGAEGTLATPLVEKENVEITSGTFYDLSGEPEAEEIYALTQGTIYVEFQSTSTGQYQSLFSVSNGTSDNPDRHFHVYMTPQGTLGMELRNTDDVFKYTMTANSVLNAKGTNRIAFKGDAATGTYSLFANGTLVQTMNKSDFKFFADISGLDHITLGGTVREGNKYPFGGTIGCAKVYGEPLSDDVLKEMTYFSSEPTLILEKEMFRLRLARDTTFRKK